MCEWAGRVQKGPKDGQDNYWETLKGLQVQKLKLVSFDCLEMGY